MVAPAYNPSNWEVEAGSGKLKASQDFLASSRTNFQTERPRFVKLRAKYEAKRYNT